MYFLRQSTAVDIAIGPFVDATDGVTAETGLTISQADVRLKKNNGAWAQVNDNTAATHEENGWYEKELDATDTNTCGVLIIAVHESGALPVWHEFQVVEEAIYDALFAASANAYTGAAGSTLARADLINIAGSAVSTTTAQLGVNVVQVSGDGTAADNLETAYDDTAGAVPWMGIIDQGTAQSGSGTTIVLRAGASFGDDTLIGATIHIVSGTGVGQRRLITDWVSATDTATVDAWITNPDNTSVYKVYASAPASNASTPLDAAGTRAALGLASANLDTQLSGLDGKLDTIDNFVDTEVATIVTAVAAIETDTQDIQSRLPAALNNGCIPADVQRINNVEVVGAGTSGDKWRA